MAGQHVYTPEQLRGLKRGNNPGPWPGSGPKPQSIKEDALRKIAGETGKTYPTILDEFAQDRELLPGERMAAIRTQAEYAGLNKQEPIILLSPEAEDLLISAVQSICEALEPYEWGEEAKRIVSEGMARAIRDKVGG